MGTSICIGGLIAAGKTSLLKELEILSQQCGLKSRVMPEMYTDTLRHIVREKLPLADSLIYGHRLQMCFDAPDFTKLYDLVFMERSFIDHLAFVDAFLEQGWIPKQQRDWFWDIARELNPPLPDKFLYLKISPEQAVARREKRPSSLKGVFNLDFMTSLETAYKRVISLYYETPLELDWSSFGEGLCRNSLLESLLDKKLSMF